MSTINNIIKSFRHSRRQVTFLAITTIFILTGCSTSKLAEIDNVSRGACNLSTKCTPNLDPREELSSLPNDKRLLSDQEEHDLAACKHEAVMAIGCNQTGYSLYGVRFNDVTKSHKRQRFIKHCMESKGYVKDSD
jgi:hypothetical protein